MKNLVTFDSRVTSVIEFRHKSSSLLLHTNRYPFCVLLDKTKWIGDYLYTAVRIFRCSEKNTKNYWVRWIDLIPVTDDFVQKTHACFYPKHRWLEYKYSSKYHCK